MAHEPILWRARAIGDSLEFLFAHDGWPEPDREFHGDRFQLGIRGDDALVGSKVLAGLIEAESVTRHQHFEPDCDVSKTLRLRRRSPLPPQVVAVIEVDPLNDNRQIRAQAAAVLEFSEDFVLALDEPELDFRFELLSL